MNGTFHFSLIDKFCFYCSYFYYKLILPFEVKRPRWRLWWYELQYTIEKFKNYKANRAYPFDDNVVVTRFGTFKIRPDTSDAANVSPAFERRDQNFLLSLIKEILGKDKRILFLDIGGDLGSYSILAANQFASDKMGIHCFEPVQSSCDLISENLRLNRVENRVVLHPVALLNQDNPETKIYLDEATPGSSTIKNSDTVQSSTIVVKAQKLDSLLLKEIPAYDVIIMKIDVEGVEKEVLLGAEKVLHEGKDVFLMVEDFIDPSIITFLQENNWHFLKKVTTYNSWWKYSSSPGSV